MKAYLATASLLCLIAVSPALAQTTSATGVGISGAEANSASGAIAVNRGNGNSNSSLTVNNPANTTATVNSNVSGTTTQNINSTLSGGTTSRIVSSGSTSVKTAPSMVAPGLAAAGLETCLGSASGTVSLMGFGIGGGSTMTDEGCQARLDSRTLASYGLKAAAVARLCQRPDIWRSMPDICQQYWPVGMPLPYGVVVAAGPAQITMSADSAGGSIRVVDGRDGVEKDCLDYSHTKFKCYHWSGERSTKRRATVAALTPVKQQPQSKGPNWTRPQEKQKAEPVPASAPPAPDNK